MPAWLRRHGWFLLLLAAGAYLRLHGLDWLPSPAGDEGNWTLYGFRILRGERAELDPNAAFVSLLYAYLIAGAMAVFGPGFWAARVVGVLAVLGTILAAYAVPYWLGSKRTGIAMAAILALHPWTVAYSRICSVPYALAFAVTTTGTLLFVAGLRKKAVLVVAAGIEVMALGAHFSPLTVIAPVACAAFALVGPHRWILRHWLTYAALAAAAVHSFPIIRSTVRVAREAPPLRPFEDLGPRLASYLHMVGTGLAGEATLRHFTNLALSPRIATLLIIPLAALIALAMSRRVRSASVLGGFGPLYLVLAIVLTPLVLAPGREWYLPANHMDRYVFAALPGFAMTMADLAALPGRGGATALGLVACLLAGNTARGAWAFLGHGGVDHGELIFDGGGGYRGWLVSREPRATMLQIRDTVLTEVGPGGAAILVADRVFIPLQFVMEGTGVPVFDVRRTWIPRRPDGRYFLVLWPEEVLSVNDPPTAPPKYVASNEWLRTRMHAKFARVRLARELRQRNGAPLLEIWRAEGPLSRRLASDLERMPEP